MADNVLEPYTFSFRDAKPASDGCSSRVWSCLLNNCHRTETSPASSESSTPTLDEWSAFATFLADAIEKYASVLEIDNAVSSTNNENQPDAVDVALAA